MQEISDFLHCTVYYTVQIQCTMQIGNKSEILAETSILDLFPKHKILCNLYCIIHCTMQEIIAFLPCTVYYTVLNTVYCADWKQNS